MKNFNLSAVLLFFLSLGASQFAEAQEEEPYKDLLFLIIDGEYEKAMSKAEKVTEKDATRREPVPYLYLSMAYYEMSKKEEFREDYPRAFRDAIKNATKFARYDKEGQYQDQFSNYITELKLDVMREARFYYEEENWRRAVTYAKYVSRMDPNDISALLLKGVAEVKSRNEYQAKTTFEEADAKLAEFSGSSLTNDELTPLRYSIIEFATLQKSKGEKEKAMPYLAAGEKVLGEDAEFRRFAEAY